MRHDRARRHERVAVLLDEEVDELLADLVRGTTCEPLAIDCAATITRKTLSERAPMSIRWALIAVVLALVFLAGDAVAQVGPAPRRPGESETPATRPR